MKIIKKIYRTIFEPNINSVLMCKFTLVLYKSGFKFLAILVRNRLISKYGIHLGLLSQMGEDLKLPHPQSIIIGEGVVIGNNCTIYHNVTLGTKHSLSVNKVEYPKLGDNVKIYTGSIILGGVQIGENSIVGANSLVLEDIEPNSVYSGIPAKKIKSYKD